jgi:hypothetical protein
MILEDVPLPTRLWLMVVAALAIAVCGLAVRVGLDLHEWSAARQIAEADGRDLGGAVPAAPPGLRALVQASGDTAPTLIGERLNTGLSKVGFQVSSTDVSGKRPMGNGLDAWTLMLRGHGRTVDGLRALAWLEANRNSIAIRSVAAQPGERDQADWTMELIVLSGAVR